MPPPTTHDPSIRRPVTSTTMKTSSAKQHGIVPGLETEDLFSNRSRTRSTDAGGAPAASSSSAGTTPVKNNHTVYDGQSHHQTSAGAVEIKYHNATSPSQTNRDHCGGTTSSSGAEGLDVNKISLCTSTSQKSTPHNLSDHFSPPTLTSYEFEFGKKTSFVEDYFPEAAECKKRQTLSLFRSPDQQFRFRTRISVVKVSFVRKVVELWRMSSSSGGLFSQKQSCSPAVEVADAVVRGEKAETNSAASCGCGDDSPSSSTGAGGRSSAPTTSKTSASPSDPPSCGTTTSGPPPPGAPDHFLKLPLVWFFHVYNRNFIGRRKVECEMRKWEDELAERSTKQGKKNGEHCSSTTTRNYNDVDEADEHREDHQGEEQNKKNVDRDTTTQVVSETIAEILKLSKLHFILFDAEPVLKCMNKNNFSSPAPAPVSCKVKKNANDVLSEIVIRETVPERMSITSLAKGLQVVCDDSFFLNTQVRCLLHNFRGEAFTGMQLHTVTTGLDMVCQFLFDGNKLEVCASSTGTGSGDRGSRPLLLKDVLRLPEQHSAGNNNKQAEQDENNGRARVHLELNGKKIDPSCEVDRGKGFVPTSDDLGDAENAGGGGAPPAANICTATAPCAVSTRPQAPAPGNKADNFAVEAEEQKQNLSFDSPEELAPFLHELFFERSAYDFEQRRSEVPTYSTTNSAKKAALLVDGAAPDERKERQEHPGGEVLPPSSHPDTTTVTRTFLFSTKDRLIVLKKSGKKQSPAQISWATTAETCRRLAAKVTLRESLQIENKTSCKAKTMMNKHSMGFEFEDHANYSKSVHDGDLQATTTARGMKKSKNFFEIHYALVFNSFSNPNPWIQISTAQWLRAMVKKYKKCWLPEQESNHISRQQNTSITSSPTRTTSLLELYCGIGSHTIALSDLFDEIHAVEIDANLVQMLERNIQLNGLVAGSPEIAKPTGSSCRTQIHAILAPSQKACKEFQKNEAVIARAKADDSWVLVDPPREGLQHASSNGKQGEKRKTRVDKTTLKFVSQFDKILYISCSPSSLRRDLDVLAGTHSVSEWAVLDHFPFTPHIENGVLLSRK
ncbi:unnamed protein product [Amoebophrya sp. A120]|nr:unnamed protein product [Amoebophrya sp. A120]|eukprot:GSA120T00000280001.1